MKCTQVKLSGAVQTGIILERHRFTSNGEFLLVTLDGRTSFGSGVTTNDMADLDMLVQ